VIGMVLVAHEHVGEAMLAALEHVMGPQALTGAVSVGVDADMDANIGDLQAHLSKVIKRCDAGDGVLLCADMFGGTPCNLALACMPEGHVEVVSGFNLPMLVKAASLRQTLNDLALLAHSCRESGRQHMHIASELLAEKGKAHG